VSAGHAIDGPHGTGGRGRALGGGGGGVLPDAFDAGGCLSKHDGGDESDGAKGDAVLYCSNSAFTLIIFAHAFTLVGISRDNKL
jgi:hypothetical protein